MRMTRGKSWSGKAWLGAVTLALILVLGLTQEQLAIVSYAQSQCKVTASSANIRKEPNAGSQALGSAEKGDSLTINHQTTASDGSVWYQVFVNAQTLGYIRSDLVSITEGGTPTQVDLAVSTGNTGSTNTADTGSTGTGTGTSTDNEPQTGVVAVEPLSASVTGGQRVRVRQKASTESSIVTTVEDGAAITVTGRVDGSDNYTWYQVEFIANGASVTGFIRSNYVNLSGELKDVTEEPVTETPPEEEVPQEEPVQQTKDWETQLQGDSWYLLNMVENSQYKIEDLFAAVEQNKAAYEDSEKAVKSQKIVIVILVILLVAAGGAVAFLVFKIKDMRDSAYFSRVEKETLRKRNSGNGGNSAGTQQSKRVMHNVGAQKGADMGAGQAQPGVRSGQGKPAGARPAGGTPQGARQSAVRPDGRPVGSKPAGGTQSRVTRPAQGAPLAGKSTRPSGVPAQGAKPTGVKSPGNQQDRGGAPGRTMPPRGSSAPAQKPRNFMTEDDEFEFEFLNWDGDEE